MHTAARAAVFGTVVLAIVAAGATGQPPAAKTTPKSTTPAPSEVAQLIADLGSDDYRTREKAGQLLTKQGEKALPEMKKVLAATEDPEVARRLAVLVRHLDHERLVAPKRVTLSMKDKPAQAFVEEISKQTGYKVNFGGAPGEGKYSFDFENVPFWEAIDHVANAAGLVVSANSYDDSSIQMHSQDSFNPHVTYAGPFRVVATSINSNRSVQLSGINRRGVNQNGRNTDQMNLSLQIQSEPKNPILGATLAEVISATDDTGASLVPPKDPNNSRSHYYNSMYRTHNTYANLPLVRLDKTATTIKTLKAKVGVVMLANVLPEVVIADPMKVKTKKFVGRTVEIDFDSLSEANNGVYTLSLTAKKLGASENGYVDYNWGNNVQQKMDLYDDKGNKLRNYGANSINNNGTAVTITLQFGPDDRFGRRVGPGGAGANAPKAGPPTKFVFNEWVTVTHQVTFEFKDIPLP